MSSARRSPGGAASMVKPAGGVGKGAATAGGGVAAGGGAAKGTPQARSNAAMASSQLIGWSSRLQRLPVVARRVVVRPAHQDVGLARSHLELEQLRLLHLVLLPDVCAQDKGRRARSAAETVGATAVRPEALDVEFIAGVPRRRNFEVIRIGHRACKYLEGAHPQRGESSDCEGSGVYSVSSCTSSPTANWSSRRRASSSALCWS